MDVKALPIILQLAELVKGKQLTKSNKNCFAIWTML